MDQEANNETTTVGVWLAKKNWRVLTVINANGQEYSLGKRLIVDDGENKENVQPIKKLQLAVRSVLYPRHFFSNLTMVKEERPNRTAGVKCQLILQEERPKRTAGVKCQLNLQDLATADLL